jgi:phosphatidylglycerol:prolipoprotein diacylglycerol transferase
VYPRFLQFGPFIIPSYGVLLAAGILCGLALSVVLARRAGLDSEKIWNLGLMGVVTAIIAARLLLTLTNWSSLRTAPFRAAPLLLLSLSGARSPVFALGGIAIALLACAAYAMRTHLPLLRTMDVAAPALALGNAFTWVACFAAGCDYGRPTSLRWGVTYTSRFAARTTGVPLGIPLHPVQLYQAAVSLGLVVLLLVLFRRRHRGDTGLHGAMRESKMQSGNTQKSKIQDGKIQDGKIQDGKIQDGKIQDGKIQDGKIQDCEIQDGEIQDGEIMGAWLFLYGLASFLLDSVRGDAQPGALFHGTLTVAQSLAMLMVLAGGLLWLRPHRLEKEAALVG